MAFLCYLVKRVSIYTWLFIFSLTVVRSKIYKKQNPNFTDMKKNNNKSYK